MRKTGFKADFQEDFRPSFFFYDLETSGLSARHDRIMQFAGQRTDLDLTPLGEPVNLLVKMPNDTLPSPTAIMVTKITPQSTQADGLTEAELCRYLMDEVFIPGTISLGYNTVRFDDEFMRHLFWRNFYDPYEWQWKDGRSRWDLLDVVRLVRALRPEGIRWPVREDGVATNRLELITKENGLKHEHAHDALSDVMASIAVAKLLREKQSQMFDYLFANRGKREVARLVNLEQKAPFVYASGRYKQEFNKTTVAFPLTAGRNGNVLVFDLRYNVEELLKERAAAAASASGDEDVAENADDTEVAAEAAAAKKGGRAQSFFPIIKELQLNRCPAVAPVGVLEKGDGWAKIGLTKKQVRENLQALLRHPEVAEQARTAYEERPEFPAAPDAESALYDGFLPDGDRRQCELVRGANLLQLSSFAPEFADERLAQIFPHYKARNFPKSLSDDERSEWEKYRLARLGRQAPSFVKDLERVEKLPERDEFVLEELKLWYQSLMPEDYE